MKVENLINNNGNRAVNQFVIYANNCIYFQSYDSMIGKYDRKSGKLYITKKWDYSVTTRKHFYIWLRDYTPYTPTRENVMRCINNKVFALVNERELEID